MTAPWLLMFRTCREISRGQVSFVVHSERIRRIGDGRYGGLRAANDNFWRHQR